MQVRGLISHDLPKMLEEISLELSLVITKEMVGKRAKGREVKFIRKKVEEPQFAIGTYLYIFDDDGVFSCAIWSNHVIHQDRKEVFFNAVPWTE